MSAPNEASMGAQISSAVLGDLAELARTDGPEQEVLDALVHAVVGAFPAARVDVVEVAEGPAPVADRPLVLPLPSVRRPGLALHVDAADHHDGLREGVEALAAVASAALLARRAGAASRRDGLTGLLNRDALHERLTEELARVRREEGDLACAVLDLDAFRAFNETAGHLAGDEVLQEVARAIEGAVRPFDAVARLDGDRFAVVMPGVSSEDAPEGVRRVFAAVTGALVDRDDRLSASLGVALLEPDMDPAGLLDAAGDALRQAKSAGGGRWVVAGTRTASVGTPDGDLDRALRGEVRTLFQPVVELDGHGLVGLEALSRGPGSLTRPDLLLEHARRAGRLIALDEELHRRAFWAADELGLASPLSLFVNIEPETLARIVGADRFWQRTASTFASLSEVTERAVLDRPGPLLRGCQRLRDLGWGIALDDLGVDPRALAMLPLVAPDVMKLDRGIVQDGTSPVALQTLLACSAQAAAGGARILAEGIETDAHHAHALSLGATFGQGWMFGRPSADIPEGVRAAPVPRAPSPRLVRGMSPYHLIAAEARTRPVDEALLLALQGELERRAAAIGATALLACAHGGAVPARARDGLTAIAGQVGLVACLAEPVDEPQPGVHDGTLEPSEPMWAEWTCVLLAPDTAVAVAARTERHEPARWKHAVTHDRELCIAVANALVSRLP